MQNNDYKVIKYTENLPIRLDKLVRKYFANLTQSLIEKMIRKKQILHNNAKAKSKTKVLYNDTVQVFIKNYNLSSESLNKEITFDYRAFQIAAKLIENIIYENNFCFVTNKISNLASQLGSKVNISIACSLQQLNLCINNNKIISADIQEKFFHIFEYLKTEEIKQKEINQSLCFKIVHRLDFDTTGCFIIAKSHAGAIFLGDQLKNKLIDKYYLAITKKQIHNSITIKTINDKTSNALNEFEVTELGPVRINNKHNNLCLAKLITGKKHQIRRHLSILNAPILFDEKYANYYYTHDEYLDIKNQTHNWCAANIEIELLLELALSMQIDAFLNLKSENKFNALYQQLGKQFDITQLNKQQFDNAQLDTETNKLSDKDLNKLIEKKLGFFIDSEDKIIIIAKLYLDFLNALEPVNKINQTSTLQNKAVNANKNNKTMLHSYILVLPKEEQYIKFLSYLTK